MSKNPFSAFLAFLLALLVSASPLVSRETRPAAAATAPEQSKAAQHAGMSHARFAKAAEQDKDLRIDKNGRPLYYCTALVYQGAPQGAQIGPDTTNFTNNPVTPVTPVTAFKLHSRPGASKVLYLDFTGFTTKGTAWNNNFNGGADFTTAVFKIPGTTSATDQTNLNAIQRIWLSVSEDYAAWDVDVTTEPPNPGAQGMRCVIGGSCNDWLKISCGGIAYLNTFNETLDGFDTPCYVFPVELGWSAGACGEATSHEFGHTFGLTHMGEVAHGSTPAQGYSSGHSITAPFSTPGGFTWAPIMGVSYGATVSHWTKGDYQYSNNDQDEIEVISSRLVPVGVAKDDHGNDTSTTSVVSGTTLTAGGVIANDSASGSLIPDLDCFKISAGVGALSVTAKTSAVCPNLHASVELLDSSGATLATAVNNSSSAMGATLTHNVPASGVYYLRVRGVGFDNGKSTVTGEPIAGYSNYGSAGRYSLTGSWQLVGNKPPVAVMSADPISGGYPLVVNFSGVGSSDIDGIVTSYAWNFGDASSGSANTSSLVTPAHTYRAPGTYVASLVVRDNQGAASAAVSRTITVTGVPTPPYCAVGAMTASFGRLNSISDFASAVVTVNDQYGNPLRGVTVYVTVSGMLSGKAIAKTNLDGQVTVNTPGFKRGKTGSMTFTVTNVTMPNYPYLPANNSPKPATVTVSR